MRLPALLGGAWGALLLARAPSLVRAVAGRPATDLEVAAARALGARQVAEAIALQRIGGRSRTWLFGIEALHAASMAGLAVVDPGRRRLALTSLSVAAVLGTLTLADR